VILLDHLNNDCTTRFFTTRFNQFVTATDMTLFMATNFHKSGKPESEEQEYLFYVIQN